MRPEADYTPEARQRARLDEAIEEILVLSQASRDQVHIVLPHYAFNEIIKIAGSASMPPDTRNVVKGFFDYRGVRFRRSDMEATYPLRDAHKFGLGEFTAIDGEYKVIDND